MKEKKPPPLRRPGDTGSSTRFGLPPDLIEKSRRRLKVVASLVVVGAGLDLVQMLVSIGKSLADTPQELGDLGDWLPFIGTVVCVSFAVVVIALTGSRRVRSASFLDVALVFEVVLCMTISITNPLSNFQDGQGLPNMTWVTPLIILFPMIVPCPPRRTLLAAFAAAATRPVGLMILESTHMVDADADAYFSSIFSPAIAIVIAFFGSRAIYGLGLEVAEARRMGSYELRERLGAGGMGEVWLARHRMLARPAAIKLVRPEFLSSADPREREVALQRFEREAQATAALRSPHTVELFDFGVTEDGTIYYVMELLEGLDARSLVRQFGPLGWERAAYLLRQVCHSLAEAHEAGLIHRDIKPANIFVCRYGREVDFVKVLDFGLVKSASESFGGDDQLTAQGIVSGTPSFMAPEQALGKNSDARADLYAVGCVAYWLLTGQLVFEGETVLEVLAHHAHTEPTAPSRVTELPIPESIDRLVLSCLEKNPDDRPQNAALLARLLEECAPVESWPEDEARHWWKLHQPELPAAHGQ